MPKPFMFSSGRGSRARRAPAAAFPLALALAMSLVTAAPAAARPDTPSKDEVEQSEEHVQERVAAVDRIQDRLSDARARMDEVSARVQRQVQKYYQEQVELERARQQYDHARQRLQGARHGAERAKDRVGALAAQQYRTGGGLRRVGSVLSARGPQGLIDRMNSLQILSRERNARLDKLRATQIVAGVLKRQAKKALAEQREATQRAEAAKQAAQQAMQQQRAEVERIQALESRLEEKLDAAQARAQRLQDKREEYLQWREEQRAARRAARQDAREQAEAAREATRQATEDAAEVSGTSSCADKPVARGYANGLIPPQALCPLPQAGHMLRADAAAAFERLNAAYTEAFGSPICVTDSYRSLAVQQQLYQVKGPDLAAVPGTSNHGWGVAVDLCGGINSYGTATHEWMRAHAPSYGWVLPSWAQATGSKPEPWHWEYTG